MKIFSRTTYWVVRAAVLLLLGFVAPIVGAQDAVNVRTIIRDSVSRRPVGDAVVELRSQHQKRSERADKNGNARFVRVTPGVYSIVTLRIGYRPQSVPVIIGTRDTTIDIGVEAIATQLAQFEVRGKSQEIFGVIAGMPDLRVIAGAKVDLPDAKRTTTSDSAGNYTFNNLKAGQYVLRITADGFAPRITAVTVPDSKAVESSHVLDVGVARTNALAGAWFDMDRRVEARGFGSAIVSSDELQRHGGTLSSALQFSREVASKGFRINGPICVFLNGRPMPGWSMDAVNPEEVAMIEVYGARGDPTNTMLSWPPNAECGNVPGAGAHASKSGLRPSFVVIWTK